MTENILFERIVQLPVGERAVFLDRECAGQPELRARVEALLAAGTVLHTPLDQPSGLERTGAYTPPLTDPTVTYGGPAPTASDVPTEGVNAVIAGRYTLVEVIGEGGMGSVYLADQSEPVKRR